MKLLFSPTRPAEEFYLYRTDRWQIRNLAADPVHAEALETHRAQLEEWMIETKDPGPESPEVYALETDDQINSTRNKTRRENYQRNAEIYKRWALEGK